MTLPPRPFLRRHAVALAASLVGVVGLGALAGCNNDDNNGTTPVLQPPILSAGDTYALTSTGRLVSFNRADPTTVRTSANVGLGNIVGGDLRPNGGQLYILSRASNGVGTLYVIDPATGNVTSTVTLSADPSDTTDTYAGLNGTRFGVDFNPVVDRLRVVSDAGQNLRINVSTGTVITDGTINPSGTQLVAAAYTNSLADACATQLYVLNATDGNLYLQNPPNDGTVGSPKTTGLGAFASTDRVTFDVRTSTARADEGVVVKNATVYGLNLSTGAATSRGTLGLASGEVVTALFVTSPAAGTTDTGTATPQQGAMMAILGSNVVTFNAGTPQKLCTSAALSGIPSGESVLGVDYRPAINATTMTYQVWGLTSGAKLFTLNPYTGAATIGATLSADATDTTDGNAAYDPTTGLPASENYGLDFNPAVDRLRVVSTSGRNLRINVDTGATTTDGNLNSTGNTPVITAAAYTNSAPQASSAERPTAVTANGTTTPATVLYDIDSGNNTLYMQNPPNNGTLVAVGALGVAGAQLNGFDIVSVRPGTDPNTQTNTAYAALTVGGVSNLYTVNTSTGAATLVNRISDGTATVRGLTRAK